MDKQAIKERIQQIKEINERLRTFKDGKSDKDLDITILSPQRFEKAIALYRKTDDEQLKQGLLYSMGKYIWYNYYHYMHIPKGSREDLENERIYKALEQRDKPLFELIEKQVDWEIEKLNRPDDFLPPGS